jgi:hypothetical protein
MPLILRTLEEMEVWMTAPSGSAATVLSGQLL